MELTFGNRDEYAASMESELGPEERQRLRALAAQQGESPQEVARRLLSSALQRAKAAETKTGKTSEGG